MTIFLVTSANPTLQPAAGDGSETFSNDRKVSKYYRRKDNAVRAAKVLAAKYPGELFGVFEAGALFEAKEPEIMEKKLNDVGEIVPRA